MSNFMNNSRMIGLVALCLLLVLPASVSAISVYGSKYMGSISPGGSDTHAMSVSMGSSDDPTDIQVEVYGFGQAMDQSYSSLNPTDDTSPYSARSFITLDNSSIHLEPGETKTINAKITVPSNVGAGGRYALIYLHALPGKGKSFTTAVLVPVLITISGTTPTETGSITDVAVGEVIQGQPITVTTTFKNTGNHHYYNTVNTITVHDASGNIVGNLSTQPSAFAIVPGNTVQYIATPNLQNLPVGTYTVDSKILIDNGTPFDQKSTTFQVKTEYVPPVTATNITLSPTSAATLTSSDGRYSVAFPQGAVTDTVVVTLKPYSISQVNPAPSGAKLGATSFEISGVSGLLSADATVKVVYSSDDLAAAGGDATLLKLSYWDAAKSQWVILPTQVNTQDTTLTATTNHLSVWAVMVSSTTSSGASSSSTSAPFPAVINIIAIAATVLILGCSVAKRGK